MIAQTSLEAYWTLDKPKISKQEHEVLEALEEVFPATNRQVSEHSKLPINVVTARMNAMSKRDVVRIAFIGSDVTGRKAKFWKPKNAKVTYED